MTQSDRIREAQINIIGEETHIEGSIQVSHSTRFHGQIKGDIVAQAGSELTFSETAVVEGNVRGDKVYVDGFIRGNIFATTQIVISGTGRVLGNIESPSFSMEFGAHFEGRSIMEEARQKREEQKAAPSSSTASPA